MSSTSGSSWQRVHFASPWNTRSLRSAFSGSCFSGSCPKADALRINAKLDSRTATDRLACFISISSKTKGRFTARPAKSVLLLPDLQLLRPGAAFRFGMCYAEMTVDAGLAVATRLRMAVLGPLGLQVGVPSVLVVAVAALERVGLL